MSVLPPRLEYGSRDFDVADLTPTPQELFAVWMAEAVAYPIPEANGACLCTSHPEGGADGRIVLLKGYDELGLVFFTNFESQKGAQLEADPRASLVFWWQPLMRQVRLRGAVARLSAEESDSYFASRPRESQLGAWASLQSRPIPARDHLDQRLAEAAERFPEGQAVPRPPSWGGFRLNPTQVEFWQGRDSRLHDRFRYGRQPDGNWSIERLMP